MIQKSVQFCIIWYKAMILTLPDHCNPNHPNIHVNTHNSYKMLLGM